MNGREHREVPTDLVDEPDAPTRLAIAAAPIDELAASIAAQGQRQPGGVVPNGERFTVVYGHRRLLAVRKLQLAFYLAYVYNSTTEALLGAQLDENVVREDLNPVEEAYWFAQLMDALHCDTDALAGRLKKTRDYVERRLLLLRGDADVRDALARGDLPIGVAELLNTIPAEAARKYFLDAALRTHPTVLTVRQWISEWKVNGAQSVAITPAGEGAPAGDVTIDDSLKPRCSFCGSDEDGYLFEFEWIHRHCKKARSNMIEARIEEGPVRNG